MLYFSILHVDIAVHIHIQYRCDPYIIDTLTWNALTFEYTLYNLVSVSSTIATLLQNSVKSNGIYYFPSHLYIKYTVFCLI